MRPSLVGRKPLMIANSVVFPAPLGPIRAVMRPAAAVNDARSTASRPPKRFDTCSTRSRGSAMVALRRYGRGGPSRTKAPAQLVEDASDAARRERHDQDENPA